MSDKSEKIYKWIESRYKHYDKIESKYTGEKYTSKIFKQASKLFNMSIEDIKLEHFKYAEQLIKQDIAKLNELKEKHEGDIRKVKQILNAYKENPELLKATELDGKTVILDVDKILQDKKRTNSKFIKFVNENKDIHFTAQTDPKISVMYHLKEDDMKWLFYEDDLIVVE